MDNIINELKRLNLENFIVIIFIIISILNYYGNEQSKKYIKTNNKINKFNANEIFKITISITLIIYIYYFFRNIEFYNKVSQSKKRIYLINLIGSSLLLAGIIMIAYFQFNQTSVIDSFDV